MQSLQLDPKNICMKVETVLQNAASELLWPLNIFHNLSESKLKYLISIPLNIVDDRNILKSLSLVDITCLKVWKKIINFYDGSEAPLHTLLRGVWIAKIFLESSLLGTAF